MSFASKGLCVQQIVGVFPEYLEHYGPENESQTSKQDIKMSVPVYVLVSHCLKSQVRGRQKLLYANLIRLPTESNVSRDICIYYNSINEVHISAATLII